MKRLHIHVSVEDLDRSIDFYSVLFSGPPDKLEADYARWKLTDPAVNFAISTRSQHRGVDHLGIQVDDEDELEALRSQVMQGELQTFDSGKTVCCYAQSDKSWLTDPGGLAWELFHSMKDVTVFHDRATTEQDCCAPHEQHDQCC